MTETRIFRIEGAGTRHAGRVRLQGARKQALETGRNRLMVTGMVFLLAFVVVAGRLVDLSVLDGAEPPRFTHGEKPAATIRRADILDRNGVILATSLPTASLYVDPAEVLDVGEAASKLLTVLPELDRGTLIDRLDGPGRFAWIKRNLTPNEKWEINRLGIPGLHFKDSERRTYPHGAMAAHVLGLTDVDGQGIAGVEKTFDANLEAGEPVRLSLDLRVQAALRSELLRSVEEFKAIGAAGVILDARSGEILGMVSLPDFDPDHPESMTTATAFNRASMGVYELGSTFKVFNTAIALDTGKVRLNDSFDASEPIRYAGFVISDFHPEKRPLTVPEILVHSSNIGSAKMALEVGGATQKAYLGRLGLLNEASLELPEVGRPLSPRPWREINTMTISYGHGIAVSPVQLTAAIGAVINGGELMPPTLLALEDGDYRQGRRVFTPETSLKMRRLLRLVVEEGTGKNADATGYRVGGKTGTAEKMIDGHYARNKLISSFVGAFPMDDPRYVVFVALDEPKGNARTLNYATAGWVAAPAVKRIVERLGPLMAVQPVIDRPATEPEPASPAVMAQRTPIEQAREYRLAAN